MKPAILSLAILLLNLSGCKDFGTSPPPPQMRQLTFSEQQLVQANGTFWLNLLKQADRTDADKNVFISPLSVSFALGMALNGADGETHEEMRTSLCLGDMPLDEINRSYKSLISTLLTIDPAIEMRIANSIWYRNTFSVEQSFLDVNQSNFDATVRPLDFVSPDAATTINAWVGEKTKGKITKIVEPPMPDDMMMYLINALYFKGTWTSRFNTENTRDDRFTLKDSSTVSCKMMNQENTFAIHSTGEYQAIDIPYSYKIFSMTIILPARGTDINSFVSSFTPTDWGQLISALKEENVVFSLPRLKCEYDLDLSNPLKALGMAIAFDQNRADFSKINRSVRLFISEAKHKTFVEVDEEGTEAAAVTSIGIAKTVAPPAFRFDRPFMFVIRERSSGTVMFVGKIMDPNG